MTTDDLLMRLNDRNVNLYLDGGRLCFRAARGVLTGELRQAVAAHREEIIRRLATESKAAPTARCNGYCDPRHWADEPVSRRLIRTTCGQFGRFIGYRREQVA
ncbi:MAG TPA: hypothetical protein VHX65_11685 [Pirellulales bacterium]|jgi:hypothetical protein|nr:hypothetical protein [Pirellulales bacterium]